MRVRFTCLVAALSVLALAEASAFAQAAVTPETIRAVFGAGARVVWAAGGNRPSSVLNIDARAEATEVRRAAALFLERYAANLGLRGVHLRAVDAERTKRQTVVRLQQEHDGVPVYQRGATVTLDAAGERIRAVHLDVADVALEPLAEIGLEAARDAAMNQLEAVPADSRAGAELVILAGPPARKVYRVVVPTLVPFGRVSVFVDAATGDIVWLRHDLMR